MKKMTIKQKVKILKEFFNLFTWKNVPEKHIKTAKWLAKNGYILGPRQEKYAPDFFTEKADNFLLKHTN